MAAITQLSPTATPGRRYGSFAGKPVWVSSGGLHVHEDARFTGRIPTFRVCMLATVGTVYARLYDNTAAVAVADSVLSTASAVKVILDSDELVFVDGHEYQTQLGKSGADAGSFYSATIIMEPC